MESVIAVKTGTWSSGSNLDNNSQCLRLALVCYFQTLTPLFIAIILLSYYLLQIILVEFSIIYFNSYIKKSNCAPQLLFKRNHEEKFRALQGWTASTLDNWDFFSISWLWIFYLCLNLVYHLFTPSRWFSVGIRVWTLVYRFHHLRVILFDPSQYLFHTHGG